MNGSVQYSEFFGGLISGGLVDKQQPAGEPAAPFRYVPGTQSQDTSSHKTTSLVSRV